MLSQCQEPSPRLQSWGQVAGVGTICHPLIVHDSVAGMAKVLTAGYAVSAEAPADAVTCPGSHLASP